MSNAVVRFAPCPIDRAQALSTALEEIWDVDFDAVAMDETPDGNWQVVGYIRDPDSSTAPRIEAALKSSFGTGHAFTVETLEQRDWVEEGLKDLQPVKAGRFVVHGAHDRHRLSPGRIGIEIEAGQAFGTGHHGTTRGCLDVLDTLVRRGGRPGKCLDLGTGSGVLAIAAALAFHIPVVATDIDPIAVSVADANARRNRAGAWVRFGCARGVNAGLIRRGAPYDLVFANILARPLILLAPDIGAITASGGVLVVSGLLERQFPPVRQAFEAAGFGLVARHRLDGWSTLVLRRHAGQK